MKPSLRIPLSSTTAWVVVSLLAVLAWGWFDPIGIRRRLDWIVEDQFLQHRTPPPVHPDLLQVSIDDLAAKRLGKSDRRHRLARAIRQLEVLGARTVVVDLLFLDEGSSNSFFDEESAYDGIPLSAESYNPDLSKRYLEDTLLTDSLARLDRVVIPFYLPSEAKDPRSSATLQAMVAKLEEKATLTASELQSDLHAEHRPGVDPRRVSRLYELACEFAADRIADDHSRAEIVLAGPACAVKERLPGAIDRRSVHSQLRQSETFPLGETVNIQNEDDQQVPLSKFARNAALGFADFQPDDDGVFRRMPMVGRWNDRAVMHQTLRAVALNHGVAPAEMRYDDGTIHCGAAQSIPVDAVGRLVINWPMNDERRGDGNHWEKAVPQLSVAELLKMADYDANLRNLKQNLRNSVNDLYIHLVLDLGFADGDKPSDLLSTIFEDYITGGLDAARSNEKRFDEEYLPRVLQHERAKAILSLAAEEDATDGEFNEDALNAAAIIGQLRPQIQSLQRERDEVYEELRNHVAGKFCLVGDTTTAGTDLKRTPIGPEIPGVTINLAAVSTMLSGRYLTTAGVLSEALLTIFVAGILSLIFGRAPAVWSFAVMAVGLLLIFYAHYFALTRADVLASPVLPLTGVFACFLVVTTRRWWHDAREKQKVREAFQFYLHPAMVDKLTRDPELVRLGGEDADLTILFADIRGFSGISEKLTAEELQKYLNGFFTPMSRIAKNHGGTLDKYIGDEMMVFFGAPLPVEDHPYQAALTALEMMERLTELQLEWRAQGLPDIRIGIGINTDVVRVGNFGSDERFDYTVIGDGVNLASRLQGATKQYGVPVLVSESTWNRLNGRIAGREVDCIQVRGKLQATRVFQLMGLPPLSDSIQKFLDFYHLGITAYHERNWEIARNCFQSAEELMANDIPSRIHLERCEEFIGNPPPADWTGVTMLTQK